MMNLSSTSNLVLILSLVISLAARAGVPKALCLVARLLLLLLSVENSAAVMDWIIGTAVAWLPIRERQQGLRAANYNENESKESRSILGKPCRVRIGMRR
jgi:hypothetical protein